MILLGDGFKKCYNTLMSKKTKNKSTTSKKRVNRTSAKTKQAVHAAQVETDGAYFLKLVLYIIIGSQWLWLVGADSAYVVPFPIGLVIGLFFASHEKFQIDRKIEYAILLIAMLIGFWAGIGITLHT